MKLQFLSNKTRKGFSIVEVAVAMGVVTLMLVTFLGIFGPAQQNVRRALSSKDANAMKDALINELSVLRSSDIGFTDSFDKAANYLIGSGSKDTAVLVYTYRAVPDSSDPSGILPAYTATGGIPGKDYVVQTAVRRMGDTRIESELTPSSVEGPVFVVLMTQLINSGTDLVSGTVGALVDPQDGTSTTPADYDDAVVAFRAQFYRLQSNLFGYVDSTNWNLVGGVPDGIGTPVIETNMAFRR